MTDAERMILRNQSVILSALQLLCSDVVGEPFEFLAEQKLKTAKFLIDHSKKENEK